MEALSDDPWATLKQLCETHGAKRIDILTGFLGNGATEALRELGVSARIIVGLPKQGAALSEAKIEEIKRLVATHQVRWLPALHAKLYVLPGRAAMIGSANFSSNGFGDLDELVAASNDDAFVAAAEKAFAGRWRKARPIDPTKLRSTGRSEGAAGEGGGLGKLAKPRKHGFKKPTTTVGAKGAPVPDATIRPVRIISSRPEGIAAGIEGLAKTTWATSPKARKGDPHIIAITDVKQGDGSGHPAVDALHSIWIACSDAFPKPKSRWKIQARLYKPIFLANPVHKAKLVAARLIKCAWPQNPSGQLFVGPRLVKLANIIAKENPGQAKQIRAALGVPAI